LNTTNAPAAAGADVTGDNTAAAITGQGALATLSTISTSECDTTIIDGGKIVTGLLTADNIQAGTLAADYIGAGSITSKAITLALTPTEGDVKIQCGKTDFGQHTTTGFILGIDDSDSDTPKFELTGGTITGTTIQTATAGARIVLDVGTPAFSLEDASANELLKMYNAPSGANTILSVTPFVSSRALFLQNDASVAMTQSLLYAGITNAASTGSTLELSHLGLGTVGFFNVGSNASRTAATVFINAYAGQGAHLELNPIATAPQTPTEGQFYTNTDHFPYYYDATAQRQIVLSGPTQTINGVKTFGSFPVTPSSAPTTNYQTANKKYVDDNVTEFFDGPGEATDVKNYWMFSIPWVISTDVPTANFWTTTTCNIETAYSSAQIVPTSDSSNRVLTTNGIFKVIGDHLGFDDSQKVIVEFGAITNGAPAAEDIGFGLSSDGVCFGDFDRQTADDACFTINGVDSGKLYAHTANAGSGHTETLITGITLENWNTYRIEFDPGVDVKFYVNGTLEATIDTNLPDGANDIKFGAGSSGNTDQEGQIALTEPKFAVEK